MKAAQEISQRASLRSGLDVEAIRKDFPILARKVHGRPLVYLDNGATSQKPQAVIDAVSRYYAEENSNIHRGVHYLSERATAAYEEAREKIKRFINAPKTQEIIFVRGTTEAINLVAQSYGRAFLKAGDEIIVSAMEHHSNIVPWQMLCEQVGARLRVIPINHDGELVMEEYRRLLTEKTKFVSVTHVSNALGTIVPVKEVVALARERGVPVMLDGAQAAPHLKLDVQAIGCDFYAFSGHKLFGPTGVGVLFGRSELLDRMPPYQGGGDMISLVTFEKTHYNVLPYKFEAGTPHIAGGIGLGAAIDYLAGVNWEQVVSHEQDLLAYATDALSSIPGLKIIGTAKEKAGVISFVFDHVHAHDVGTILDQEGIAVRAGHHCAMPVMQRFGVPATTRASFAFYNTRDEVDALKRAIHQVLRVFG
ncbi:MAG TPA: cysteine desulfurase [Candidatus Acidoferrales bacterium]|jgi:cysteine desulfurase / selenocysteine lyase|nr:cysteine desulfurase [Candidatus Acidoferrales bacterium]